VSVADGVRWREPMALRGARCLPRLAGARAPVLAALGHLRPPGGKPVSTATTARPRDIRAVESPRPRAEDVGAIGRLGRYTATHFRTVLTAWVLVARVLEFS